MRTAIVHYWLTARRGGEKVLEALCSLFPQAVIFTHVCDRASLSPLLARHEIRRTFISRLPFAGRCYRHYLPLMPLALEELDLREFDLVISSESGPAKGVLTPARTPHLCYCHSPMRYLWDMYLNYREQSGPVTRVLMAPLFHRLRQWDALSALRVDRFVANSRNVAGRIAKIYRRKARVVHPPVDVDFFAQNPGGQERTHYLFFSQLESYKRADLAIAACNAARLPLVVLGEGREQKRLRALAGPTVRFAGRQSAVEVRRLLRSARALLFPGEEDFGIVIAEALAAACPVIAYGAGGALEIVREGESGLFFREQSAEALLDALERFARMEKDFDPGALLAGASRFRPENFAAGMRAQVDALLAREHIREDADDGCA
jgi:glycosyltransferase involved in cell wall biosynthesis